MSTSGRRNLAVYEAKREAILATTAQTCRFCYERAIKDSPYCSDHAAAVKSKRGLDR